jgi:hypothetical protein
VQLKLGFLSDVLIGAGRAGVSLRCSDWCSSGFLSEVLIGLAGLSVRDFDWCRSGCAFSRMFGLVQVGLGFLFDVLIVQLKLGFLSVF